MKNPPSINTQPENTITFLNRSPSASLIAPKIGSPVNALCIPISKPDHDEQGKSNPPKSNGEAQPPHHSAHISNISIPKRRNTWRGEADNPTTDKAIQEPKNENPSCGGVDLEREPDGEGEHAREKQDDGEGVEDAESVGDGAGDDAAEG